MKDDLISPLTSCSPTKPTIAGFTNFHRSTPPLAPPIPTPTEATIEIVKVVITNIENRPPPMTIKGKQLLRDQLVSYHDELKELGAYSPAHAVECNTWAARAIQIAKKCCAG